MSLDIRRACDQPHRLSKQSVAGMKVPARARLSDSLIFGAARNEIAGKAHHRGGHAPESLSPRGRSPYMAG